MIDRPNISTVPGCPDPSLMEVCLFVAYSSSSYRHYKIDKAPSSDNDAAF